uniref:HAT C-terminal dimerisation domain-containing protein n=1 Tax=Sinocyclocheilus rhinocerous TaxID=307959 RepID=A0A673L9X0_9TELE
MAGQSFTFLRWKYSNYFELVEEREKGIVVKCRLCVGENSCQLTTEMDEKEPNDTCTPPQAKQQKLDFSSPSPGKTISSTELNKLVAAFIVEEMQPLSTVEAPTFRNIISKISVTGKRTGGVLPDRKTFTNFLDNAYMEMETDLKKTFADLEYVSTTANLWTAQNKSFLGITVHWIDPASLHRQKAAIACRRFRGRHTYDAIAAEIEQILCSFALCGKITATVTDNGANFVKAFRMFQADDDEAENNEDEVIFTDLHEVLRDDSETSERYILPPHHRCASHTLNLICTNDVVKFLTAKADCKAVYRSATGKCSALWSKVSRSTVASEILAEFSKRKLLVPATTRWNSYHDALSRVTDIPLVDLNQLYTRLDIRCITERECQFLKEYCKVLKPVCMALDILQGEDDCFYGTLQPTLEILMAKILALKEVYKLCNLSKILLQAIKTRFSTILDSDEALLAAVTLPKFKLRWLRDETRKDTIKMTLAAQCRALTVEIPQKEPLQSPESRDHENDFFAFPEEENQHDKQASTVDMEICEYLKSADMGNLHDFPRILKIFLKANTATPSSVPVERLFSIGSLILTPKRNRLTDQHFERLLLLRYNHYFENKTQKK